MKRPLITAITPTYNCKNDAEATLKSLLAQDVENVECVVVDGASTDGTVDVLKKYEELFEKKGVKYKWVSEKDGGVPFALNKGIDLSTGRYLIFMGGGDLLAKDSFRGVYNILASRKYDLVYGNHKRLGGRKIYKFKLNPINKFRHFKECKICHQTVFYKRSVFKRLGYYDTKYWAASDANLNIRCFAKKYGLKILYVDKVIATYKGSGGSDRHRDEQFLKDKYGIIKEDYGAFSAGIFKILDTLDTLLSGKKQLY